MSAWYKPALATEASSGNLSCVDRNEVLETCPGHKESPGSLGELERHSAVKGQARGDLRAAPWKRQANPTYTLHRFKREIRLTKRWKEN